MKMIAGSCLRAIANSRRMRAAPRPANISTNDAADCAKNCAPGFVRDGLRQQRLAGSRRTVQQDALGHLRAQLLEGLRVAQELDDLLQLRLGLVDARDVLEGDRLLGGRFDLLRLDPRHHLQRAPQQEDDRREEQDPHDRLPLKGPVLDVLHERGVRCATGASVVLTVSVPPCCVCASRACSSRAVGAAITPRTAAVTSAFAFPAIPPSLASSLKYAGSHARSARNLNGARNLPAGWHPCGLSRARARRDLGRTRVANARSRTSMRSSAAWISGVAREQRLVALGKEAVGHALRERLAEVARVGEARQDHGHDLRTRIVL